MTERIGVVGAGIVGLAIAQALSRTGDHEVTVLEKEPRVAAHQTGHNSGVVHAGIYYQPGSLKAKLCAKGRVMTREYCQEHSLPYKETGKLVVALNAGEISRLDEIERRSALNKVPDLARVSQEKMREIEPHAAGVAALHSPHTAVVDYAAIAETMANQIRLAGGSVLLNQKVAAVESVSGTCVVSTTGGTHTFDRLVVCAGLHSDVIAKLVGAADAPRILPFRGEYWALDPARSNLVNGMIYPVPDPAFPFLGVHFTRGVYDDIHVGPNAVPALAREGYSWGKISPRELWEVLRWPGAGRLAREHWKMGGKEIAASVLKPLYFSAAQAFIPELKLSDLTHKTMSGVRAQAWAKDGSLLDDFAVDQIGPITLLRNAPSPAATSAMAIAEHVLLNYLGIKR
ncbi:L-2-hydroxyglutarate oxidase [Paeniglutamicibacter antarcticus]|uniref:L-2-hydroxyglutarate oxidase n=1 Tax=Paeniglutamicibacter antarcticus TaxID=494023 RepID=UPI001AE8BBAF